MSSANLMLVFIPLVLGTAGVAALVMQRRQARRDAETAAAESHAKLWTDRPLDALQARWQHLQVRLRGLRARADEAGEAAEAAKQRRDQHQRAIRDGQPITPVYVALMSGLGVFWLVIFVMQIMLDYMILKGLHPSSVILPFALGTAAALGIAGLAALLVVTLGGHEGVVSLPQTSNAKRAIGLFIAAVLVIIVGILVAVAPARSQLTDGKAVTDKQKLLAQAKTAEPRDDLAVQAAEADLAAARQRLDRAEVVDRAYALLTPTFEVALSLPAVAAAELLILAAASRRARRLSQRAAAARTTRDEALDAWTADVTGELVRFGHGQDVLDAFLERLNRPRHASAPDPPPREAATAPPGNGDRPPPDPPPPGGAVRPDRLTAVPDPPGEGAADPSAGQPDPSEWDESA